jgi:serine kinase of HPr protein (carbohydrate metabolism regulator)
MSIIHASCIDIAGIGVLLQGPPRSGKSDLALRLIDGDARLVADDQVELTVREGVLWAASPKALAGRMEIRGIGIVAVPWEPRTPVRLVVDLVAPSEVERMPESSESEIEGVRLHRLALAPFEASAPSKIRFIARAERVGERWRDA